MSNYHLALGIGDFEADIAYGKSAAGGNNKVILFKGRDDKPLILNQELMASISKDLAPLYPEGLELTIHSAMFTHATRPAEAESRKLVGICLGAGFDLSKLPLVGKYLPADQMIGIDEAQAFFSSAPWSAAETGELASILPPSELTLPPYLNQGGNLSFAVKLPGGQPLYIALGTTNASSQAPAGAKPERPATQPGATFWLNVDKTIGKLTVRRIGARYYESKLHFMFDASMLLGPVTLFLEGLSAGSRLDRFEPEFHLDGIGIAYEKPGLQVAGGLLYNALTESFYGDAFIKTKTFTISALGAYKEVNGQHSLFIYGMLERAVGIGPPCFEVTGIAAGFGYNRSVRIPEAVNVGNFSLVKAAGMGNGSKDPMTVLETMKDDVPVTPGAHFFVVGMKFNNFKTVYSFGLLIVSLQDDWRVDVVGVSTVTAPINETDEKKILARVEVNWTVQYDRQQGALAVHGVLAPERAFLLTKDNKLRGEFVYTMWLDGPHAGDFVFSLGGYHQKFSPPAHYPKVARLEFNWQVWNDEVKVGSLWFERKFSYSGTMYWALTPNAMMIGGVLDVLFKFGAGFKEDLEIGDYKLAGVEFSGMVEARFFFDLDVLISWMPYYYDVKFEIAITLKATFKGRGYLDLGIFKIDETVTKTYDVERYASLHIWGPELAGRAAVDWDVIKFDIAFGDSSKPEPKPIDWATFRTNFLPPAAEACSVVLEEGGMRQLDGGVWIVDPNDLVIATHTVVPSTTVSAGTTTFERWNITKIGAQTIELPTGNVEIPAYEIREAPMGIAPMDIAHINSATHTVKVLDTDNGNADVTHKFTYSSVTKNVPRAVWGSDFQPKIDGGGLLENMLMGLRIVPIPPAPPTMTDSLPIDSFEYDLELKDNAYSWQDAPAQTAKASAAVMRAMNTTPTNTRRDSLLDVLGLNKEKVQFSSNLGNEFLA